MTQENFRKKKKYGQNFLVGDTVVRKIVAGSGITADCGVLEIGPGAGALTKELLGAAGRVLSVEIDDEPPYCANTSPACRCAYAPTCPTISPPRF